MSPPESSMINLPGVTHTLQNALWNPRQGKAWRAERVCDLWLNPQVPEHLWAQATGTLHILSVIYEYRYDQTRDLRIKLYRPHFYTYELGPNFTSPGIQGLISPQESP